MNSNNTGGPAFPTHLNLTQGMTLRDYFAAQALSAVIADKDTQTVFNQHKETADFQYVAALIAYSFADAMLEKRNAA